MNVNEPTAHSVAEDLSDRSNSSNSESQLHAFQDYGKIRELNLSINKAKEPPVNRSKDFSFALDVSRQHGISFGILTADRLAKELPVSRDKPKEFDFQPEKIKDISSYSLDRSEDTDASLDTTKDYVSNLSSRPNENDVIFSFDGIKDVHFPRETRDNRTKNVHFPVDRNKDLNFQKTTYNHPPDRIKDFNFALDRRRDSHLGAGSALERLRGGSFFEPAEYRNAQMQPRDELEAMTIERMRRSHILTSDIVPRNLSAHLPQAHSITEMQHSQQQHQQQGKSFTIDSILGLRNNQRDKPQKNQLHPYRKHQGQESTAKNSSSGSGSVSSGKLKRVRTIFTAEQLERLEGEFARQQYMVGPERLYLAHALRLTEAQVKVWFQNRRIKWRKLHHEQQSQRLHELHSLSSLAQDVEDSNENSDCQDVFKPDYPRTSSGHPFLGELETTRSSTTEHTEPSPVPSTTMDQADIEAQSQTRKLRRGRHVSSYDWPSWASKLPADGTSASDSYWKTGPRPTHSVPHSHAQRRHDYGITEPVTSCYSASNTYRPKSRTLAPVLPKSSHVPTSDQNYQTSHHSSRSARNKLLTTNNVAVVRKPCYKNDPEEDEEVKYVEDDVNYADENADDDPVEEVDEDQDENFEYNDKDYEEQEADDEVDDESDAFQSKLHRNQQKLHKMPNHRTEHLRQSEQQHDLRKGQNQQRSLKMYQDQKLPRFYSHGSDTQQALLHDTSYGDAAELITDEEHTPPLTPPRRSSRRMSELHRTVPSWLPARKSFERNRERVASPLMTASQLQPRRQQCLAQHQHHEQHQQNTLHQHQHSRKHRSAKPELESLMVPHPSSPIAKKCCICGGSTAPITMRVGSPRKGNCRLHEFRGFTVKGPPGEDGEAEEQVVCARCMKRHNMEDLRLGCESPSPEAAPLYSGKSHRLRTHRSSMYDCPEENLNVDEMLAAYASSQPRTNSHNYPMASRERTRHSMQSARSPLRRSSYYER